MKKKISFTLNGSQIDVTADSHQTLLDVCAEPARFWSTA
jgi:aerobic-type carbon monoxide dehydrogenase small subunit (CoxS/CutS family)